MKSKITFSCKEGGKEHKVTLKGNRKAVQSIEDILLSRRIQKDIIKAFDTMDEISSRVLAGNTSEGISKQMVFATMYTEAEVKDLLEKIVDTLRLGFNINVNPSAFSKVFFNEHKK